MKIWCCFKRGISIITDLFYPRHCAICGRIILGTKKVALCLKCEKKTLKTKVVRDDRFFFDEAVSVVKYKGKARDAMINYKFKSVKYYSDAYACLINLAVGERVDVKNAIMCPVPLSKGRKRAYSQTALIAEKLSKEWDSVYIPDLMYKCREVGQLSKMKLPERKFYIKDSMDVNPQYDIYDKDIVVIDDIYTSGTTANECARTLKMYGAARVFVLCACYD